MLLMRIFCGILLKITSLTKTEYCQFIKQFEPRSEVNSTMRELVKRSLTGTYLYSQCVMPGISTMSA